MAKALDLAQRDILFMVAGTLLLMVGLIFGSAIGIDAEL